MQRIPSQLLFVLGDASRYQDTFARVWVVRRMCPEPFVIPLREKAELCYGLEDACLGFSRREQPSQRG